MPQSKQFKFCLYTIQYRWKLGVYRTPHSIQLLSWLYLEKSRRAIRAFLRHSRLGHSARWPQNSNHNMSQTIEQGGPVVPWIDGVAARVPKMEVCYLACEEGWRVILVRQTSDASSYPNDPTNSTNLVIRITTYHPHMRPRNQGNRKEYYNHGFIFRSFLAHCLCSISCNPHRF